MTYDDGIQVAINLLSSYTAVNLGSCSFNALAPVAGPTPSVQPYIDELEKLKEGDDAGDYNTGLHDAIWLLGKYDIAGTADEPKLVEVDSPVQRMTLYISRLQARLLRE